MKALSIISVGLYLMTFVFLVIAVAGSSRPDKLRRRGAEFGAYFAGIVLLTLGNVPAATVALVDGVQLDTMTAVFSSVRTLIIAVMFVRLGKILLSGYAQREALKKHIAQLERRGEHGDD